MLACGVMTLSDAAKAVDYETIVLLFGMMVVVAYLRMAGFFALATDGIAARFSAPLPLLAVTIGISGDALGLPGQRRGLRGADAPVLGSADGSSDRPFPT